MPDNKREPAQAAAPRTGGPVSPGAAPFCAVGVGASAGGMEAFRQMLRALGPRTGMAYVLIMHMPMKHESALAEILSRDSEMPVADLTDGVRLKRDHVYVLPAGYDAAVEDGTVRLTPRSAEAGHHRPIDKFLHSLAEHHGEKSIGVILSGTASDGALGIQEIKAAGGITFAQDDTAAHTSMPRSAIHTGAIDFVLNPADIARELARIASHPIVTAPAPVDTVPLPDIEPVLEILRDATGVDFTHYKRNTLYRRIARRLVLHKLEGVSHYVDYLQSTPAEAEALYQDVLINVTSFFRNPEAFEALKTDVFPVITDNRSRHDPVRIWTLGCSTGEEAYSLAMAFTEFADTLGRRVPLQVFATDLNASSIDRARAGVYTHAALADVSAERLRRFFHESDGGYRVDKAIRDTCVFARHNVLSDPPFSRTDLVSCRNMLIYLGAELQQKVIPVLHYALRPNGFLWLGTSETIGSHRDLFDLKNTRYKIYSRKAGASRLPATVSRLPARLPTATDAPVPNAPADARPFDVQKEVERLLLARYAPPGVLVRADLEILQYRGDTSPYLAPMPGRASLNLLKMLRESLVLGVRSAIQRARAEEAPVRQENLCVSSEGAERRVSVEVIPVKSGVERAALFMVVFEDAPRREPETRSDGAAPSPYDEATAQEVARLREELTATREYLQSVIEQQEAANEELQSANEEVQAANEELQSINEELETSKEEVQSSNEELATVNDELHGRNTELGQMNNDLVNLLSSVQIAIVMLDADRRIRRFTPTAERLLNLIPTDVGRPVSDIKMNFDVPDLQRLIAEAMDTVSVRERELQDRDGRWHSLRVRPYRTLDNRIDGAVLVFVDVDTLKRSQELLLRQTELLDQAHEPIMMWALDGAVGYWNRAAEDTYGFTAEEAIGRKVHELLLAAPGYASYRDALAREGRWTGELVHTRRDGVKIVVESRMVVVTDTDGRRRVVEADWPIAAHKESERVLRGIADDLTTADRHKDEFLAMLAHELRNPLAPLRNVSAVLGAEGAAPEQKSRALQVMNRAVGNMTRLIDDLLDVSRIRQSQLELRRSPIDLIAVVRRVVEQYDSTFALKRQTLHLGLPDAEHCVNGDAVRLDQIVGNLLNNASKYTPAGGEIWIDIESVGNGAGAREEVELRVRDNGPGIPAEKLPYVFDLFIRGVHASDGQYGGLGVGLTLVHRLTELHDGSVEARSGGASGGSEFVVRLPRVRSPATA